MIAFPILIIVSSIIGLILFDYLVWTEFTTDVRAWLADGKPRGFFWSPQNLSPEMAKHRRSLTATYRLSFFWLISTPEWARGNRRAQVALVLLRCVTSFNILLFPTYVLVNYLT